MARGIAAAKAGDKEEARSILTGVLHRDADNEQAWLWLGAVVNSPRETMICLKRVLAINPDNQQAKEGIKWASAKLAQAKRTPLVESRPFRRNGEVKTPSEAIPVSRSPSRFRVIERAMTPSRPSGPVASPQPTASGISGKLSEAVLRTAPLSTVKTMIGYPSGEDGVTMEGLVRSQWIPLLMILLLSLSLVMGVILLAWLLFSRQPIGYGW